MGSRIACHFANAGVGVLLLDMAATELTDQEKSRGLTAADPRVRNRIVNSALQQALASTPSPVFTPEVASRITTGNFDDDMKDIAACDWVIEAVVEDLKIKRSLYEQVEHYRAAGSLVTTNTSGIPIHLLAEGRSEDFRRHFCGTHFFNPPRYLRLLEVIPGPETDTEVTGFLRHYGEVFLGKTTVECKDTPAFIANRVGVFSMMAIFHLMEELDLSIDEVDALTGPVVGHPKSATFRTADVVGIDTLVRVARGLAQNCPDDEAAAFFEIPGFVTRLVEAGRLGQKTGAGFYRKEKTPGKPEILTLDLKTFAYRPKSRPRFASIDQARGVENLKARLALLSEADDKAGAFYRKFHSLLFSYVAHRIPEISDELYKIDDAMKAGFGWELGPFELWDLLGVEKTGERMKKEAFSLPSWVEEMLAAGKDSFYRSSQGRRLFYDQQEKRYREIPGSAAFILLENYADKVVWKNDACSLTDIGDGVLNLSWSTKMNTIGGEVLEGVNLSIQRAEKDFAGLVIANEGAVFSAGANVGLIFMLAAEQEWEELHLAVKTFQRTSMHIRYSAVPVVVAPRGMTLGGGCEFCLHADGVQAAAETYMGLVETGVGLIPAGGGTKEFAVRASEAYRKGQVDIPILQQRFITVAMAKVSGSAADAYGLGYLRAGCDRYTMNENRGIAEAKKRVLDMAAAGYSRPEERNDIKVLGRESLGAFLAGINGMWRGNYISEYDKKVGAKLAWVMSGGDLSQPQQVSEQYLLDLEREAFVSLCGERKTLERLESVLKTGRPVRN
jgi:3-hydroxyacyl-CoA dehydrogenase